MTTVILLMLRHVMWWKLLVRSKWRRFENWIICKIVTRIFDHLIKEITEYLLIRNAVPQILHCFHKRCQIYVVWANWRYWRRRRSLFWRRWSNGNSHASIKRTVVWWIEVFEYKRKPREVDRNTNLCTWVTCEA